MDMKALNIALDREILRPPDFLERDTIINIEPTKIKLFTPYERLEKHIYCFENVLCVVSRA